MYAVVVNEGPLSAEDNATYFSKEKPGFVLVEYQTSDEESVKFGRFITFVPTNGRSKGKLMSVPAERVVSISEDA
jgi:hypothetical protein